MSDPIRITVIEAGAIPLTRWSDSCCCWKLMKGQTGPEDMPPRVLVRVSEEGARALAAHLDEEIEITIRSIPKGGPK